MRICHVTCHLPPDQAANALLPAHLGWWAREAGDDPFYVAHPPRAIAGRAPSALRDVEQELAGPVTWVEARRQDAQNSGNPPGVISVELLRIRRAATAALASADIVHLHSNGLLPEASGLLATTPWQACGAHPVRHGGLALHTKAVRRGSVRAGVRLGVARHLLQPRPDGPRGRTRLVARAADRGLPAGGRLLQPGRRSGETAGAGVSGAARAEHPPQRQAPPSAGRPAGSPGGHACRPGRSSRHPTRHLRNRAAARRPDRTRRGARHQRVGDIRGPRRQPDDCALPGRRRTSSSCRRSWKPARPWRSRRSRPARRLFPPTIRAAVELGLLFGDDVQVVPKNDPPALAAALIRFLSNKRRTGPTSDETLSDHFRPRAVAARFNDIYREVVSASRR